MWLFSNIEIGDSLSSYTMTKMVIHQMIWSLDNFYSNNPSSGVTFRITTILILKQELVTCTLLRPPKVIVKFDRITRILILCECCLQLLELFCFELLHVLATRISDVIILHHDIMTLATAIETSFL